MQLWELNRNKPFGCKVLFYDPIIKKKSQDQALDGILLSKSH
jgi:phosphoglycerate dehydrogenase-like enzyme